MTINVAHADMLLSAAPRNARPRLTIPALWERVRGFIASILDEHGSPRTQYHQRLDAKQRSAILRWLKPTERMARHLILVAAITRLLMTPEGVRLRATATPLAPPPPPRKPLPLVDTGINLWTSIADYQLARAQREMRAAAEAADQSVREATGAQPERDPDDPANWRASLQILRWSRDTPTAPPPRPRGAAAAPDPRRLIRRIEAVRRALETPEPRIRRLIRHLARLPRGALGLSPPHVRHRGRPNPVLHDEIFALHDLLDAAVDIFNTS